MSSEYKVGDVTNSRTYLLKLVQICLTFVVPHAINVLGQFKWFQRLPVLHEATFICGNDAIIPIAVLRGKTERGNLSRRETTYRHEVHWETVQLLNNLQRLAVAPSIIETDGAGAMFRATRI